MSTDLRPTWSSVHVHLHESGPATDRLIVEAIAPAVTRALRDQPKEWFFVRYWDGGPHVRVRVRSLNGAVHDLIADIADWLSGQPKRAPRLTPEDYYRELATPPTAVWREDHEIVSVDYEPEVSRYGGPAGLEISEALFVRSSEVAAAGIQAATSPERRLTLTFDLTLAFVSGLGLSGPDQVRWLRRHVLSMAPAADGVNGDLRVLTERAGRELEARRDAYLRRRDALSKTLVSETSTSLHRHWAGVVAQALAAYRAVPDLEADPLAILSSQLHMFHNRMGMTVAEECHLTMLASLAIAAGPGPTGFFDDGFEASDRAYNEASKYRPEDLPAQLPRKPRNPARRPSLETVSLEPPPASLGVDLGQALLTRRSAYGTYDGSIGLDQLSRLLGLAAGTSPAVPTRRTYPSGGAMYPVRVYILPYKVDGLRPAVYAYEASGHSLLRLGEVPTIKSLLECSPLGLDGPPGPVDATAAPLWMVVAADLRRSRSRYGLRAYRLLLLEAGHLAQNVCLVAGALGLATVTLAGIYDDLLAMQLGMDGASEFPVYLLPIAPAGGVSPLPIEQPGETWERR